MTMRMKYVCFALSMLVSVCAIAHADGKTLTVGKSKTGCPNAEYTTIASAVTAAAPGDVIEICPALYPEQLVISKPLTLRGVRTTVAGNEVNRVLLQPSLQDVQDLPVEAVITVINTWGVRIENLAIDASRNSVQGCTPQLADIHFHNASGRVADDALFGAQLATPPKLCGDLSWEWFRSSCRFRQTRPLLRDGRGQQYSRLYEGWCLGHQRWGDSKSRRQSHCRGWAEHPVPVWSFHRKRCGGPDQRQHHHRRPLRLTVIQ